ncbi:MAG: hypothetical protein WBP12_00855 [Candidatus Saccharimonas sp.]
MNQYETPDYRKFGVPPVVATKVDVSRMVSDLERVDAELTTAEIRGGDHTTPAMSEQLHEFLSQNNISLDNSQYRTDLLKEARKLKDNVPIIHMTFAVAADPESLQQLVAWTRQSVHPQAVIEVGLQPALIAGVHVRTTNHIKDLSMRGALKGGHAILVKELEALRG